MHRFARAIVVAIAFVPAAASAGLINTPPSGPPLVGSGPRNHPAPPVITTRFTQVTESEWKLQIGQQAPGTIDCGGDGNFFARVSPGQNGPWTFRFVRSDGSSSQPVNVPAAPELGGHWAPTSAPFGKEFEDRTALRGHVNEWFEVTFAGKTLLSPSLVEICK